MKNELGYNSDSETDQLYGWDTFASTGNEGTELDGCRGFFNSKFYKSNSEKG